LLNVKVTDEFMNLFYHDIKDHKLTNSNTKINLHVLRIANNKFDYHKLVSELHENIINYCLSPKELQDLEGTTGGKKYILAVNKLRDYESNEGELGEILLYCMLESHLKAPKIMTKMELKTSSKDYVKGSDGVHLLQINDTDFHLIFGESKLTKKFQKGLYEAFNSIAEFINRPKNNINDEVILINTHLNNEALTEEAYQFIKKVLFPNQLKEEIYTDNAFSIFIGFGLELTDEDWNLPNHEFREKVRRTIIEMVEKEYKYIEKKIVEKKLGGYSFYLYAIPFFNLEETRKLIIKNLKGASNDF